MRHLESSRVDRTLILLKLQKLLRDSDQIKITTSLTSQEPLTKVSVFTIISANSNSADTVECRVIVGRKTESAKFKISLDTQPRGQGPYQSSQELVSATKIYNIFKLAGSRRQRNLDLNLSL